MFKTTLKTDWKFWVKAALIRAIKTFAQVMLGFVAITGADFASIDWLTALSVSGVAALASILTSIVGLPETNKEDNSNGSESDLGTGS